MQTVAELGAVIAFWAATAAFFTTVGALVREGLDRAYLRRVAMTHVFYLSDGEKSEMMSLDDLVHNLYLSDAAEPNFRSTSDLVIDVTGALDAQGFWHGMIGMYNVAIVSVELAQKLLHAVDGESVPARDPGLERYDHPL